MINEIHGRLYAHPPMSKTLSPGASMSMACEFLDNIAIQLAYFVQTQYRWGMKDPAQYAGTGTAQCPALRPPREGPVVIR